MILCVVIAFLASRTTAQLGNWDIIFQSIETNFQDSMTDEIIIKFQIGSERDFMVDLLEKNCGLTVYSDETVIPTATAIERTANVTTNHDEVKIKLILDKTKSVSDLRRNENLHFCVRVRLLSGDSIIKEE